VKIQRQNVPQQHEDADEVVSTLVVFEEEKKDDYDDDDESEDDSDTDGPVPSLQKSSDRTRPQEEEEEEPRSVPVRPRDRKGQWDGSTTEKGKTKQQCRRIHNKHQDEYH